MLDTRSRNVIGIVLLLATVTGTANLHADDGQSSATSAGSSWRWTPEEWTYTEKYEEIQGYARRPDETVLQSMTVEWQPPELDELGNFCTIRGRLSVPGDGGAGKRPVDWFQGVTVYIAKAPGNRPDWSKGMDQENTLHDATVVSPSGEFVASFDLRESQHDSTRAQPLQFGLALAKHTATGDLSQTVVWNSQTPALARAVQMLTVPPAGKISRELALINRAAGWPFSDPNGVALIRAVNALQRLGKVRALETLTKYAELAGNFDDGEIVFWIIHALFEPIRVGDRIPGPMIAVWLDEEALPEAAKWPLNPIAVVNDVPFMLGRQIALGGVPEPPSMHIEWARRHGVVRDQPLWPDVNPLLAAETILGSQQFQQLDEIARDEATRLVRAQAYAMVAGLLPAVPMDAQHDLDDEVQWRSRVEESAAREIHWDAETEQFVVKGR